MKIRNIYGREILDSRGNPTVEVELTLDNGKYLKNNPDSQIVYSTMMDIQVPLKEGDSITVTPRMTDTYGRIFESIESHFCVENGIIEITDYPGLEDLQRASTIVP